MFQSASVRSHLVALLAVAAATGGLIFLQNELPAWFNLPIVVLAYLPAINIATQMGGFGIGVIAAIASFLSLNFFFINPRGTLLVNNVTDLILLAIFLVVALVNSQFLGRAQRRAIEAAQRERDAAHFYELSLALISARGPDDVASTLADRLHAILGAQAVSVQLQPAQAAQRRAAIPKQPLPDQPPSHIEPILSARGTLGEIHVWRAAPLTIGEGRLLRTFAGEAALILERMRMSDAENRAKVLEESDRLKTALLGSVSHELRTPLAAIRAGMESLRAGLVSPDTEAGRELLADVDEAAAHLTRLVNNMLDMSKIESGAWKPQRQWTDLDDVINGAAARLRSELSQHTLDIRIPDDLPLVPADPVQLDQVFTNLISNSAKYAPPATPIRIAASMPDRESVLVQVTNESPYLPAEDLERIFDKFYRVTNADRVVGTGLGLSICKGIVEAHGGRIWATNRPNAERGVTFNFILPLTWDGAAPKLPPAESTELAIASHDSFVIHYPQS